MARDLFDLPRERCTVYLDAEHMEVIKRIQEGVGGNRSQVIRFALDYGLRRMEKKMKESKAREGSASV